MIESIFKSLSSFSVGLLFFSLTKSVLIWFPLFTLIVLIVAVVLSYGLYYYYCKVLKCFNSLAVVEIQPVEQELIPTYIGLFIILISLGELDLFMQILLIILLFLIWFFFLERTYYFNLLWLLIFRYYKVKDEYGNTYLIYSKKKDLKKNDSTGDIIKFNKLVRVNNFTFIDKENY